MLIKQKMKLYDEKQVSKLKASATDSKKDELKSSKKPSSGEKEPTKSKGGKSKKQQSTFNDILETYVWKYVDSLDDKLEDVSGKVMAKLDKLVDRIIDGQEQPEGEFELGDSDD